MTPLELRDFWTEVVKNNNGFEFKDSYTGWGPNIQGPNCHSRTQNWRARPKTSIVEHERHYD